MKTFIDRFDEYMNYAGLNDNRVTVQAGITVGLIGSARKRGKSLSGENIGKILYEYKDLNARWLLTGEGEMLYKEANIPISDNSDLILNMFNKVIQLQEELKRVELENVELKHKLGIETSSSSKVG